MTKVEARLRRDNKELLKNLKQMLSLLEKQSAFAKAMALCELLDNSSGSVAYVEAKNACAIFVDAGRALIPWEER